MLQGKKNRTRQPIAPHHLIHSPLSLTFWESSASFSLASRQKSEFSKMAFQTSHPLTPLSFSAAPLPLWWPACGTHACHTLLWPETHSSHCLDNLFLSFLRFYCEVLCSVMSSLPTQTKCFLPCSTHDSLFRPLTWHRPHGTASLSVFLSRKIVQLFIFSSFTLID